MDPLSITAAVVGLLGTAGKIGPVFFKVKSALVEAPLFMDQLFGQVTELKVVLTAVNAFLLKIEAAPRRRLSLIQVDQLVATLTELVLTFSELEALVSSSALNIDGGLADRMTVEWKEDVISKILTRLERHKTSLSLMLNIVQCDSDLEAEHSQSTLYELVEQLVESNSDIARRLRTLEDVCDAQSIRTIRSGNASGEEATRSSNESIDTARQMDPSGDERAAIIGPRAIEGDLHVSRVYQRTHRYDVEDASLSSSAARTHAWSVLSDLSLSQISPISVVALPVYASDVFNDSWYSFGISRSTLVALDSELGAGAARRPRCRVLVVGGKDLSHTDVTALLVSLHCSQSATSNLFTIEMRSTTIEILDTTSSGADLESRAWWLPRAHGLIFLYSAANRESFKQALQLHRRSLMPIQQSTGLDAIDSWDGYVKPRPPQTRPCMLIGSVPASWTTRNELMREEITYDEGKDMARDLGCYFAETWNHHKTALASLDKADAFHRFLYSVVPASYA